MKSRRFPRIFLLLGLWVCRRWITSTTRNRHPRSGGRSNWRRFMRRSHNGRIFCSWSRLRYTNWLRRAGLARAGISNGKSLALPEYDWSMNDIQRRLFKTRFVLIAVALVLAGLAMGLHRLIQ